MLNKLVIGASLALALAACTSSSPTREVKPLGFTPTSPAVGCVADTATRIPVRPGECAGTGRTYTQSDINRTGARTTTEALQLLDPSLLY